MQPSSAAAAERVFSVLNKSFSDQQRSPLKDYIEASVILQYNNRCTVFGKQVATSQIMDRSLEHNEIKARESENS